MSNDFISDEDAHLEDRFRDLEQEAELDRLRRGEPSTPAQNAKGDDPLSKMKSALDNDTDLERYVLALCPHCDAKNRVSLTKLRGGNPKCGACKQTLSFTQL